MDRIFGTPQEPLFNQKYIGITSDILQEWLVSLAQKNSEEISKGNSHRELFRSGAFSEFIFLTSEVFKMAPEAKYLAVELFERFMVKHIQDLQKHLCKPGHKRKSTDWGVLHNHVKLRIVSCCQIASKLTSHYKVVSMVQAKKFLNEHGLRYTSDGILQSELRVLKTLDFNVSIPSTLTYIETLLEILGFNNKDMEVKVYHAIAMKVLNVVYMKFTDLYKKLYEVTVHDPSHTQRKKFETVKADRMLLSVAVIVSSVYITDQYVTDKVADELSKITRIICDDILDFATVIVQMVIDNNEI